MILILHFPKKVKTMLKICHSTRVITYSCYHLDTRVPFFYCYLSRLALKQKGQQNQPADNYTPCLDMTKRKQKQKKDEPFDHCLQNSENSLIFLYLY